LTGAAPESKQHVRLTDARGVRTVTVYRKEAWIMRKLMVLGIFCMLAVLALPGLAAQQPDVPADGLKMNKGGKKEVIFNHSTHKEQTCVTCHHPVEDKEDFRACTTAGCHDNLDPKDKTPTAYNQVIHNKKNPKFQTCVSCHEKVAGDDKDKKKALTACAKSKCHP
jgi:hypothetical protein